MLFWFNILVGYALSKGSRIYVQNNKLIPLELSNPSGELVKIYPDKNTAIFSIATWCPHSREFIQLLQDQQIKPMLVHKRLIFVLDEEWSKYAEVRWETLAPQIEKGEISKSDAIESLKSEIKAAKEARNGSMVLFPQVLEKLPGNYYYVTETSRKLSNIQNQGFPGGYSAKTGKFDKHAIDTLANLGLPHNLLFNRFKSTRD